MRGLHGARTAGGRNPRDLPGHSDSHFPLSFGIHIIFGKKNRQISFLMDSLALGLAGVLELGSGPYSAEAQQWLSGNTNAVLTEDSATPCSVPPPLPQDGALA